MVDDGLGCARTSAIEEDQSAKGGQPFQERGPNRVVPPQIDVGEARDVDHIRRSLADDLVGDLGPAHVHVSGLRAFHSRQQSDSRSRRSPDARGAGWMRDSGRVGKRSRRHSL